MPILVVAVHAERYDAPSDGRGSDLLVRIVWDGHTRGAMSQHLARPRGHRPTATASLALRPALSTGFGSSKKAYEFRRYTGFPA